MATKKTGVLVGIAAIAVIGVAAVLYFSQWPPAEEEVTGAIGALRGHLHGGANEAAMELISRFDSAEAAAKGVHEMLARKDLIMGFGHRVYKNYDPRAKIIRQICHDLLDELGDDNPNKPLLKIAMDLEKIALEDEYFIKRKLYGFTPRGFFRGRY